MPDSLFSILDIKNWKPACQGQADRLDIQNWALDIQNSLFDIQDFLNVEPARLQSIPLFTLQAVQAGIEVFQSTTILHFPFISLWLKIAATYKPFAQLLTSSRAV